MKKLLLILLVTVSFSAIAQTAVTPPAIVKTKFDSIFPNATGTKWAKSGIDYEASFTNDKKTMKAKFMVNGNYVQKELMIDQTALPTAAKNYILTNCSGQNVLNVYKVTKANGNVTYSASVGGKAMYFDQSGNKIAAPKK